MLVQFCEKLLQIFTFCGSVIFLIIGFLLKILHLSLLFFLFGCEVVQAMDHYL